MLGPLNFGTESEAPVPRMIDVMDMMDMMDTIA